MTNIEKKQLTDKLLDSATEVFAEYSEATDDALIKTYYRVATHMTMGDTHLVKEEFEKLREDIQTLLMENVCAVAEKLVDTTAKDKYVS